MMVHAAHMIETAPARPLDLTDQSDRRRISFGALQAYTRIMENWGVTQQDAASLLGGMSLATYRRHLSKVLDKNKDVATLSQDEIIRISYITGIEKALRIVFSKPNAHKWFKEKNTGPLFEGQSPLDYALAGGIVALDQTRQLVDSYRGYLS